MKIEKLQNAREKILRQGLTVKEWSEKNGFEPFYVYRILNGSVKGRGGKALKIANALGLYDED